MMSPANGFSAMATTMVRRSSSESPALRQSLRKVGVSMTVCMIYTAMPEGKAPGASSGSALGV